MKKSAVIWLLLLILSVVRSCGYSQIKNTIKGSFPDSNSYEITPGLDKRGLQSTTRTLHEFRMNFYYTDLDTFISSNPSLSSKAEMTKRVYDRMANYYKTFFKVNYLDSFKTGVFTCGGKIYGALTISADFLVLVAPENDSSTTYFAAAAPCLGDSSSGRPVIGVYHLNFARMDTNPRAEYSYFHLMMHEATHLLGFSDSYYTKFRKSDGITAYTASEAMKTSTIGGKTFTFLTYPSLVSFAKSYYGCSSLVGVPLENEGGSSSAGSHWEKTFLPNELMNPSVENNLVISDFTIELLKATGWYTISSGASQVYSWGKNEGCSLFSWCPTAKGYCTTAQYKKSFCSPDYRSKSECTDGSFFTDKCPTLKATQNICDFKISSDQVSKEDREIYGPGSRCVDLITKSNVEVLTPTCAKVSCTSSNTLTVSFSSGQQFTCASSGQRISIDSSSDIKCPDLADFCGKLSDQCPDDCYQEGMGICMKGGNCFCFQGNSNSGNCNPDPAFISTSPKSDNSPSPVQRDSSSSVGTNQVSTTQVAASSGKENSTIAKVVNENKRGLVTTIQKLMVTLVSGMILLFK